MQGASSTQESLSELSSGQCHREASIDYPSTSSKQSTEQLIEENSTQSDTKLETSLLDSEKLKDSLVRSELLAQGSLDALSNDKEAALSGLSAQATTLQEYTLTQTCFI